MSWTEIPSSPAQPFVPRSRQANRLPWRSLNADSNSTEIFNKQNVSAHRREETRENDVGDSSPHVVVRSRPSQLQLLEAQAMRREQEKDLMALGGLKLLDAPLAPPAEEAQPTWPERPKPPPKEQMPRQRRRPPLAPGKRSATIPEPPVESRSNRPAVPSSGHVRPLSSSNSSGNSTLISLDRPPCPTDQPPSAELEPKMRQDSATSVGSLASSGYGSGISKASDYSAISLPPESPLSRQSSFDEWTKPSIPTLQPFGGRVGLSPSLRATLARKKQESESQQSRRRTPWRSDDSTDDVFAESSNWPEDTTSCTSLSSLTEEARQG